MKLTMTARGTFQVVALLALGSSLANAAPVCTGNGTGTPGANVYYCADIFLPPGTEANAPWSTIVSLPRFNTVAPGGTYVLDAVTVGLGWGTTGSIHVENRDPAADHAFTNATSTVPLTIVLPGGVAGNCPAGICQNATAGPIDSATTTPTDVYDPPNAPTFANRPGVFGEPVPDAATLCEFFGNFPNCGNALVNGYYDKNGLTNSGLTTAGVPTSGFSGPGAAFLLFGANAGNGSYSGTGSDFLTFGGSADAGGYVSVFYEYHFVPVQTPEPVTLAMVGSALLGLGVFLRKKKS